MLRYCQSCVRSFMPHIEKYYQREVLAQLQRNRTCRFYSRSQQTSRATTSFLSSSTGRVAGRCVLVALGACVGMKIWLVTSDCQGASTAPPGTRPNPPQTERRGRKCQTLEEAIMKSKDILQRIKDETGSPGIAVGVSVDGENVWSQGLGYADVENRVPCTPDTVMRIASISKPVTTTIVGKLMEEGLLDIDKPVQTYVPKFPEKSVSGEKVTITTRQVLTHLSGIRHYSKDYMKQDKKDGDETSSSKAQSKETGSTDKPPADRTADKPGTPEMELVEMYIKRHCDSVEEGVNLFKDDPLVHKPGTKFLYTTHGYTLLSAVIEGATKKSFTTLLQELFKDLGLQNTYLDEYTPLIYNRSRYYMKTEKGQLMNAPYVDNSYKWAGGGLLSTVGDLIKFGNIMLYSYQFKHPEESHSKSVSPKQDPSTQSAPPKQDLTRADLKNIVQKSKEDREAENKEISQERDTERNKAMSGYLKRETVDKLWTIGARRPSDFDKNAGYGLGWSVVPENMEHGCCRHQRHHIGHAGAAIGASSVLIMVPGSKGDNPPSGVVVAIIANMISVRLIKTAQKIAQEFENIE